MTLKHIVKANPKYRDEEHESIKAGKPDESYGDV
jgi:hypothetical protein